MTWQDLDKCWSIVIGYMKTVVLGEAIMTCSREGVIKPEPRQISTVVGQAWIERMYDLCHLVSGSKINKYRDV
jgi:hypothetical protein